MSVCNQDSKCLEYSQGYENAKREIESSFGGLDGVISSIGTSLGELNVPDDYLGSKVEEALTCINTNLTGIKDKVEELKSSALGFASNKASEHMSHYLKWIDEQETEEEEKN